MKKIIVLFAVLCMAGISVNTFATTLNQDAADCSDSTEVKFSVDPTYTVSIPADASVSYDDNKATSTDFGAITATRICLEPTKMIVVSVSAELSMKNSTDNAKTIPYTISSAGRAFTSACLLETNDSAALTIDITAKAWEEAYAGNYSDTVTFTIACVNRTERP